MNTTLPEDTSMIDILMEILSLKRPFRGANERYVAEGILSRLPGGMKVFNDASGLPMAYVYTTDPASTTLFVGHLDTVHREDGPNPVIYDEEMEWMSKADGQALGADDGAGVTVLYMMAKAGVPGTYLFPTGEERGGIGSGWMADNAPEFLRKFKRAITFDRKGTHSVITHQSCGRCCSDQFAEVLAAVLTTTIPNGYEFEPDSTGVFTDTANFIDYIPECTNVSAGYRNEHSGNETLDVGYLKSLLEACLKINWEELPTKREAGEREASKWPWASDWTANDGYAGGAAVTIDDYLAMSDVELEDMCWESPESAVRLLMELQEYFKCNVGKNDVDKNDPAISGFY